MIVHRESGSLLLKVRPDAYNTLRQILPAHSKPIDFQGHNLAVPHNLKVTKILRNMGIKAPSPVRYYYPFPRPARFADVFEHQYSTVDFLTLNHRCFVLNEMGTSKTASACWAADYLMQQRLVKRVLIVTPLSTMEMVWQNELFDVCMHRTSAILHGTAEQRLNKLAMEVDFYIINPDGLKIVASQVMRRKDIDLIIVDEASDYRSAQTDKYEVLEKVVRDRRLWLMSGAPCPNAPTDAWALARLVNKSLVPDYFTQFKRATMNQISTYKWVPKPGSHELAYKAMQPAIRFKKADCMTLPPVTYTNRSCPLSPEQTKMYGEMKQHLVSAASSGEVISAANAADKISKLRQILAGAIKTGEDTYEVVPHGPRFKVLQEAIRQASAKVLVIVPFKGIVRALTDEINDWHFKEADGLRCAMVNGDVSLTDRNRIFQDFRDDPSLNELICHPKVMSHGLTLTQADMCIFYAPIYSNDQSTQVMDRFNRAGQTKKMTVLRIVANSLEQGIYAMIEGKRDTQESILSLYKKELQI